MECATGARSCFRYLVEKSRPVAAPLHNRLVGRLRRVLPGGGLCSAKEARDQLFTEPSNERKQEIDRNMWREVCGTEWVLWVNKYRSDELFLAHQIRCGRHHLI